MPERSTISANIIEYLDTSAIAIKKKLYFIDYKIIKFKKGGQDW
jgi:hypothetical protein